MSVQHMRDDAHDIERELLAAIDAVTEAEHWREDVDRRKLEQLAAFDDEERRAFTAWKEANRRYEAARRARAEVVASR